MQENIILENQKGVAVRTFEWEANELFLIYRHDTRRVEIVPETNSLTECGNRISI